MYDILKDIETGYGTGIEEHVMKILVVGGTRFFGIPMVNAQLSAGHDV